MKKLFKKTGITIIDILFLPFTVIAAYWLKLIRMYNVGLFETISTTSGKIFNFVGVFPITYHYYEPFMGKLAFSQKTKRKLPGIDFNIEN